jgi:hypothetical protein
MRREGEEIFEYAERLSSFWKAELDPAVSDRVALRSLAKRPA